MKSLLFAKSVYILMVVSIFIFSYPLTIPVSQSKMESENYEIELPGFGAGGGNLDSTNYEVDSTVGQTAPGLFSSSGYTVRSGFQYIQSIIPFSFSVEDIAVDFGSLSASTPVTSTSDLTVKAGGAFGYSIKAQENHPLENQFSTQILDTICDSGPCSETSAEVWTSTATTGFGFNIQGDDVPSDFVDGTYYRQFADASSAEDPAVIMTKTDVTWDYPSNSWPWESVATVTYKVNIGNTQAGGTYQNVVMYTAIPSF